MKKPKPKPKRMTAKQYRDALDRLGLTSSSQRTSKLLGMGMRQCQRIHAGESPVPVPVELLLKLYAKHGLPKETE